MITGVASAKLFGGDASICVNACHPGVVTSSELPVCDVFTLLGERGLQVLVILQLSWYLSSDFPTAISFPSSTGPKSIHEGKGVILHSHL